MVVLIVLFTMGDELNVIAHWRTLGQNLDKGMKMLSQCTLAVVG